MFAKFIRAFRTHSSERFIIQLRDAEDYGVVDLHYLQTGNVAGTVIIFEHREVNDAQVYELLQTIDELLLPGVSIEQNQVSFTVVHGQVIGNYSPDKSG